jgi:putative transposase
MTQRRVHTEGTYAHFVTFSCFNRRNLLHPDNCKRVVLGCMAAQLKRQSGKCIGFVLMPNHVHALIWFPEENQSSVFMNKWKDGSSSKIAGIYQRSFTKYWSKLPANDPVWQKRYYDFNIYSEVKLREKLEYMHNNPVKAGLVKDACDWPWSSARYWLQGKSVGVPIGWPG